MRKLSILIAVALGVMGVACADADPDEEDMAASQDEIRVARSFVAKGTGYFPENSAMEGGFFDRKGAKLRTLQQFLDGKAEYVSVAMDSKAFPYGQRLRIRELNAKYKKEIVFRVVDTGGAFRGKGTSRMDICTANSKAAHDATINGRLNVDVIDEKSGPPEITPDPASGGGTTTTPPSSQTTTITPTPKPRPTTEPSAPSTPVTTPEPVVTEPAPPSTSGGGKACASDGACNPGNDGSGLICVSGRCTAGCRSNAHCPGSTTCQSGQCR